MSLPESTATGRSAERLRSMIASRDAPARGARLAVREAKPRAVRTPLREEQALGARSAQWSSRSVSLRGYSGSGSGRAQIHVPGAALGHHRLAGEPDASYPARHRLRVGGEAGLLGEGRSIPRHRP
jgi:hypothetical protein